ncbi:uncharacterized protein LOC141600826 [Silene latifolia]|uniref:uncharacterized protein LOC141600826 n=1 Tax=Silene latifolia TaxID=37657 RepID=UPI003D783E4E
MKVFQSPASLRASTPRTELITVRVIRMWLRTSDKNPTVVQGVEFILADQNGYAIQASIKKNLVKLFLELLNEGDTYKIRKFNNSSNRLGYDMATFHPCKIWFEYSTKVIPVTIPDIPLSVHTFYTFREFAIGAMLDKLNQQLCCTVFGEYVKQMTKTEETFKNKNKPTLVLLYIKRFVYNVLCPKQLIKFQRILTSFPAAEVEQNLFGVPENAAHHPPILASANIKSLDEIQNMTQGGSYVTMVTFVELATSGVSWFYNSCTECRLKVQNKDDGLWYCDKDRPNKPPCSLKGIGTKSAIPRFQVKFFVTYENTNLCEFIIWDDAMTELLGKTAQQILDEDEIFNLVPPPDFRPLLERDFIVKIRVTKDFNIEQKSTSYGVICLCDDPKTISKWKNIHAASKEKLREMNEDEPVTEVQELTPQKGVVVVAETSDKSSATKQQEIKMGKAPMGP